MNAIRCPQCAAVNQISATACRQCLFPFGNIASSAYVSVPVEEIYQAQNPGFNNASPISPDNETGRKTFFWYRVYCGAMAGLYLLVTILGVGMNVFPIDTGQEAQEMMFFGAIYAVMGAIFLVVFAVFLFLPRKPYNWIVGIVAMALGMTCCCLLPALIPLLIFWVKPETKAFFGRN